MCGHWNLNFIQFSCVMKYFSFDVFQPFIDVKTILRWLSNNTSGWTHLMDSSSCTPPLKDFHEEFKNFSWSFFCHVINYSGIYFSVGEEKVLFNDPNFLQLSSRIRLKHLSTDWHLQEEMGPRYIAETILIDPLFPGNRLSKLLSS